MTEKSVFDTITFTNDNPKADKIEVKYLIQLYSDQNWIDLSELFPDIESCKEILALWRLNNRLASFRIVKRIIIDEVMDVIQ